MTEDNRPSPEALLEAIERAEDRAHRGRLKVFLGMCPGVGKTYAMLEAARRELAAGREVVIGYVETHGRAETEALARGIPSVPRRQVEHRGVGLAEMDLDGLLARRPQLTLVDELAHTNAPGSRHTKRWQDVRELLDAGLDVFTTLNVQHIESRAELVREITGLAQHETVPDSVLDQAEFELVDLPPADLLRRLREGKVYLPDRAATAAANFFREGNLMALREIALRLAAEHAGQNVREYLAEHPPPGAWKTSQRLLTAISPSPLSESLARWTRQLADSLQAPWLAVYVDTGRALSDDENRRLERNLALARELGAEVLVTRSDDLVTAVLRVARQHHVTQIVVGKPARARTLDWLRGGSLLTRLMRESGNIDIHCVRAADVSEPAPKSRAASIPATVWRQCLWAALVVAGVTLAGFAVRRFVGYPSVSLVYLLTVVVLALFLGRGPMLFAATACALLWNFLFLPPHYTFQIAEVEDLLMFGMFFVVAITMGQLTARIRAHAATEQAREQQATALYLLTRSLAACNDPAGLLGVAVSQLSSVFRADVAILLSAAEGESRLVAYPFGTLTLSDKDVGVADWAFRNARPAGRGTDTLGSSEALFLPLVTPTGCVGVVGLRFGGGRLPSLGEQTLLENSIRQVALMVDLARLREAETRASLLAESERLGRSLLNSVSHELCTPLTAIAGAAGALATTGPLTPGQQSLTREIRAAVARLDRLVRNLLGAARLQAGHVRPALDWCDVRDVVNAALENAQTALQSRSVEVTLAPALPLLRLDATLTEQALANLLVNAGTHTPEGTPIEVVGRVEGGELRIAVADRGPGLGAAGTEHLFAEFRSSLHVRSSGTGLGLSIVRGFIEAQGGHVEASNRPGGGAVFTLRLPVPPAPTLPEEAP